MKSELEFRSRKAQIWLKVLLSSLTLPFDLWPWLFAWTSLLSMIITSENFMIIRWHKQRKSCDGQTDGWTESFIKLLGRSLKKQGQSEEFDSCDRPSNINQVGFKSTIFWPRMIFKFDGWPQKIIGHLLYATSSFACASFHSHQWIQTGVTVQKRPIRVKIGDFLSRVTLKLDGWPWKTIEHLSSATSSFVHHFIAICVFKQELWSGNG